MLRVRTFVAPVTAIALLSMSPAQAQVVNVTDGGFSFSISGQINRGFLYFDDGVDSDTFFVDNDNSSTRLRARLEYDFGEYVVGAFAEYEFEVSSTAAVNQLDSHISNSISNERFFEVYTKTPFGKFSYGQGDTASNGTSEVDLSGTSVVGYSSVSDISGGLLLRNPDDTLSTNRIGNFFSNFDGNSRVERFRYDTPEFGGGFVASVSFGEDSRNDIALRYNKSYGDIKVGSAISYNERQGADRLNGSISALHVPSGFSATFATGSDDLDAGGRDPGFNYIKIGYQTDKIVSWGKTAFAIDYYDGSDVQSNGSDSESIGLLAVQKVDSLNLEIYGGYRMFTASNSTTDFQDFDALLIGARYKF